MHRIQQPRVTTSIGVKKHFRIPSRCIFDVEKKKGKEKVFDKIILRFNGKSKKKKKIEREREETKIRSQ